MIYVKDIDFAQNSYMQFTQKELFLLLAMGIGIVLLLWLFTLYPRYYMIKMSGVGSAWSAFIPIWQDIQMFKIAGFKWWYYLIYIIIYTTGYFTSGWLYFISLLTFAIFSVILHWKICTNFKIGILGKIMSIFFGWFVLWYIALAKKPFATTITYNQQK